jgi:outer membrane protein assembly factor BamB
LPIQPVWKFNTGGEVHSSAAIQGSTAFVGSDSGKFFALDLTTGKQKWLFATSGKIRGSPAVSRGIVVFGSNDGTLYAVDTANGQKKWDFKTHDWIRAAPAIADNKVVFAGWDRCVYALNLQTGKEIWRYVTRKEIDVAPVVHNGQVFVNSLDWVIYALNLKTGKLNWHFIRGDAAGMAVYRDIVVFLGRRGGVAFLCPENGQPAIKMMLHGRRDNASFGVPVFSKDMMYTARWHKGGPATIDLKTGKRGSTWHSTGCVTSPLVGKDVMIVPDITGAVQAWNILQKKKVWEWKTKSGKMFHASPVAAAGYIVVGNDDGFVYGFRYSE